ncbi:hypothetical protein ACHMW6_06220 [Pseudoduganella sp. UC29_106]|uniref:hypothetical protein n=1 Tax=Pseudoduganella sp. UC29_106 TaxID=3374553 RepID=UPI003757335A
MKERPILFSGHMIRALLSGSKTQTRRVVKHQPSDHHWQCLPGYELLAGLSEYSDAMGVAFHHTIPQNPATDSDRPVMCPFGKPGDRLWVRETFFAYGRWITRYSEKKGRDEWHFIDMTLECDRAYQYEADNPDVPVASGRGGPLPGWYKRPAIFMPRAASRIAADVTAVRVEPLCDINQGDALAEGMLSVRTREWDEQYFPEWRRAFDEACEQGRKPPVGPLPSQAFRELWKDINGADSWDANPWVWCIEFRKLST